jgi:DNA (cytosine-5)-methyltransferase 1
VSRPRLLDLFCGAGGAAMGYHRAGFDVIGVDIKPQSHYPFLFIQDDVFEFAESHELDWYDAIHASPPCQSYSKSVSIENRKKHPDLIAQTRSLLKETGLPYVIENVPGAPLENPVQLCGSAFGLPIQRHRLFETNFPIMSPGCIHGAYPRQYPPAWNRTTPLRVLSISGGWTTEVDFAQHKAAMLVDWEVTPKELSEAIPPAYTQFIGEQLLAVLNTEEVMSKQT